MLIIKGKAVNGLLTLFQFWWHVFSRRELAFTEYISSQTTTQVVCHYKKSLKMSAISSHFLFVSAVFGTKCMTYCRSNISKTMKEPQEQIVFAFITGTRQF